MYTAPQTQMERKNLQNNGSESLLHQAIQLSFTPSFFSHGWEYSLSPIHEFPNTYVDSPGNFLISLQKVRMAITKLTHLFEIRIFPSMNILMRLFL